MRQALALLLLVATGACVAYTPPDQVTPQPSPLPQAQRPLAIAANPTVTPAVDGILSTTAAAGQFSGAALVARNDQVVFLEAYGLADRDAKLSNRSDTQFDIGSVGKIFTAVAILQLVQHGQVALTAPISTYLPSYRREIADQITVEQLLTHTSGLGDYITKPPYWAGAKDQLRALEDYLPLFEQDPLGFAPGTSWKYSNAGYILLGLIVERVSGQDYWTFIQQHIFAPAGMTRSDSNERDAVVPNRAINYTRLDERLQIGPGPAEPNTRWLPPHAGPDGGGSSTVEDLFRFAQALRSGVLLDPRYTEIMLQGRVSAEQFGPGFRWGYGLAEHRLGGARVLGHGGSTHGGEALLEWEPEFGYTFVMLTNQDPAVGAQPDFPPLPQLEERMIRTLPVR